MKLLYGDCLNELKNIPNNSIDLVLSDPPYGITYCKWDSIISFDLLWNQLNRIIKDNSAIVLTASQPFTTLLINSNLKMFKYNWVWGKNCPSNIACSNYQPMRYTEDIVVFSKNKHKFNKQMISRSESGSKVIKRHQKNKTTFKLSKSNVSSNTSTEVNPYKYDINLKNPSNLISFGVVRGKKRKHPTQKPVELMEYLIKTYTDENDLVLDFAMGSGTTGIACKNLNRKFIGIEKNLKYFKIAEERCK